MRRLHLIDGSPAPHVTWHEDPDAIPECPCNPTIRVDLKRGRVVIQHNSL